MRKQNLNEIWCCLIIIAVFICWLNFITGCAGAPTSTKPDAVYMFDMSGSVNGYDFNGVGVVPYSGTYEMKIEAKTDIDLLTISSCHRDFHQEAAIKKGWFEARRGFEYDFHPTPGIENTGSCLVRIGAYTKSGGQAAWAVLDFQTPDAILPAMNYCNGEVQPSGGVSICQSRAGLVQRLVFDRPVEVSKKMDPRCQMKEIGDDHLIWEAALPVGECVQIFQEIDRPHRQHRHTTFSYTDILIRGN